MREIYILCAWWSRPAVTRLHVWSIQRFISLSPVNYRVHYVAVLSPEDEHLSELREIASEFDVVMASNEHLGDKHNAGVEYILQRCGPESYLMNIGSDDLIDPAYWLQIDAMWGKDMFGMSSLYVTNEAQTQIIKVKCYLIGAGRLVLTDRIRQIRNFSDGGMYTKHKQRGLDGDSANRLTASGAEYSVLDRNHAYILDIKTRVNINKMSTFNRLKTTFPVTRSDIVHFFPDNYRIPDDACQGYAHLPKNVPLKAGMKVHILSNGAIHPITIRGINWGKCTVTARCNHPELNRRTFHFSQLIE